MTLTTSWTGTTADLVFTDLENVRANCSELACVTGIAEKTVTAAAVWLRNGYARWAHVMVDGHITDGLPCEVLPVSFYNERHIKV